MRKKVVILLLSWLPALAGKGQQRFVNFTVKDGLPDKLIYAIAQDAAGYMWFGTATGLYRYDGHRFRSVQSPLDRPGRTISNVLQVIAADRASNFWISSPNTLQWYNPVTNHFSGPDYNNPAVKALCDASVTHITTMPGGMLLASVRQHFFSFNQADSSFFSWSSLYPPTASKTTLRVFYTQHAVWAVHAEGIYRFSAARQFTGFYAVPGGDISNGHADTATGQLILTTWGNGLYRFDLNRHTAEKYMPGTTAMDKESLFCIGKSTTGSLWVGGYRLFGLSNGNNIDAVYQASRDNEYDLGVSKISNLFFDREGNLWIGSFSGLAMMPWQNNQVRTVLLLDKVSGNNVEPQGLLQVPGTRELLIANTSSAGLMHYDMRTGLLSTIRNPFGGPVENARIISLVAAPDGSVYAGDDVHFFRYLPEKRQLQPMVLKDNNGRAITGIGRNVYDNKGNVYIASQNNGFYIWQPSAGRLTQYNKWDIDSAAGRDGDNICYPTIADRDNNIWFISSSGVYEFRQSTRRFYHHGWKPSAGHIPITDARSIAQDKAGHYWITSQNNGLFELYFENGKEVLRNYTESGQIGLGTDNLGKIKAGPDSCLWIGTLTGLVRFDPFQKRVLSTFGQQHGMRENDQGYTFNITADGTLVQLYYAAMNIIDLNTYRFSTKPPPLAFNSIKVFDREYVYELDGRRPGLNLPSGSNFLQFEFAALSFNNSNQNQYMYMLEGADKEWVYSGNRNTVTYAGLKPGTYTFKVRGAGNDGAWSAVQQVQVIIRPPFYATWWFLLLVLAAVAGIVYWWNRHRIAAVKKEEKLKSDFRQQIAETEMKALRAQMNPHFIFNCLNSIQKYILQQDHFAASQYLTRFSRLIRLILDHSNQGSIPLASELELLKLYVEMEQLRFSNKFDFVVETDAAVRADEWEIPSMLIQPYVENAIWHGLMHKEERGRLVLRITAEEKDTVAVVVEDNGIGRAMAAALKSKQVLKKKSFGMQITEDRIAIINRTRPGITTCVVEDLLDAQGHAAGTRVRLTIPVTQTFKMQHHDKGSTD